MSKFYGVGVGPGDPELVTLKAKKVLETVEVVCIPVSKKDRESVAYQIAKRFIHPGSEMVELLLPMSNNDEELQKHWQEAGAKIASYLEEQKNVAFITLGDPLIYSTFGYLMRTVKEMKPETEIITVPGITSFSAAAAKTNTVLTEGRETLKIVPLPVEECSLNNNLEIEDNLVFLKVSAQTEDLINSIIKNGNKTGIYVSRCGQPGEEIITDLKILKSQKADYLSLMLIKNI